MTEIEVLRKEVERLEDQLQRQTEYLLALRERVRRLELVAQLLVGELPDKPRYNDCRDCEVAGRCLDLPNVFCDYHNVFCDYHPAE